MDDPTQAFYDDLADWYHLIFQDWARSIQWQASVLDPLIERELRSAHLKILDCACGIGTQALGLTEPRHALVGIDLSAAAIARAKREAQQRSLSIQFEVADMRDLSGVSKSDFDVVLAADKVLPHLLTEQDLSWAFSRFAPNSPKLKTWKQRSSRPKHVGFLTVDRDRLHRRRDSRPSSFSNLGVGVYLSKRDGIFAEAVQ